MHRLWRLRPGLSRDRDFRPGRFTGKVGQLYARQRRLVRPAGKVGDLRAGFAGSLRRHLRAAFFLCSRSLAPTLSIAKSSIPETDSGRSCLKAIRSCLAIALAFLLFFTAFLIAGNAQAPANHKTLTPPSPGTVEGNWAGSLEAGDALLHLVLHVSKSPDGSFKATIDSLDQGVYGIEVTALMQNGSDVRFSVSSVGAQFEGKFSAGHAGIQGTWSQGNVGLPLSFHRQAVSAGAKKPGDAIASVEGVWQAATEANGLRLRFQLHVTHDDEKHLVAALDSPDQGISGLPAVNVSQKLTVFHFEIPVVQGVYEGNLNAAKSVITGTWTQGGITRNLNFQRSDQLLELVRPQNPKKPYPYRDEDVTGHSPFLVLADHLARKGIAVLRYDKRGIGKSAGNYDQATTEGFASDAEAAGNYLKSRKEINATKIGLIGHSEGGLIAPMIASRSSDVAWMVLLAAPGLKGEQVMLLQSELILKAAGFDDDRIAKARDFSLQSYALARKEKDPEVLETKLTDLVDSTGMSTTLPPTTLKPQAQMMTSPWFRFFLDYDPIPALKKTQCPVLALNGDKDLQIASKENLEQIAKALREGGNKDFQTHELAGLNHLFQH